MLAVDYKQSGHAVVLATAHLAHTGIGSRLPEHQRAHRIAPVHRIKQVAYLTLMYLIEEIGHGKIALPDIQRPFVWSATQTAWSSLPVV